MSNDERIKLNTSKRMHRGLVALAVVVGSLMAVGAASASAAVHWSDSTHGIKVSGSLTVSALGHTSKTCTAAEKQTSLMGSNYAVIKSSGEELRFACAGGGSLGMLFYAAPTSTTSVQVGFPYELALSPWGGTYREYAFGPAVADFSNGSGATASTLAFSNDEIGREGTTALLLTGTLNVTTSTGGLLTLLP